MKKQLLVLVILLTSITQLSAQITPFMQERFQHTLDSVGNRYKFKGISAAILIPGQGVWKGTYGISHEGAPLTTDMALGMGSNTKTFICALLLQMQDSGLIALDDTIGKWIQGYPNINGQITIRQCLNHTSGLAEYFSQGINDSLFGNPAKIWTKQEMLSIVGAPLAAPGATWGYCNTNYIIAGVIIESVLGKPAYQAMREWVLNRKQYNQTFFHGENNPTPVAHQWTMNLQPGQLTNMNEFQVNIIEQLYSLASTAGAMRTTAEDNVRFWHDLVSGNLLSPRGWNEMTTLVPIGSNQFYGLGIFLKSRNINGRTIWSHGGTYLGSISENLVDTTSGIAVSVLTNQDSFSNIFVINTIERALHRATLNMPATGVAEMSQEKAKVYPNPAQNELLIEFAGVDPVSYTIMNIQGKVVQQSGFSREIDVSGLQDGMYILTPESSQGPLTPVRFAIHR